MGESPKNKSNSKRFSPINKSSVKRVSTGRNLTGNARLVRDLAADIHASVQQWNAAYLQGVSVLKGITEEKQDEAYSQKLQELCDNLESVCNALDAVTKNLEEITHRMKIVSQLHKSTDELFGTWPTTKFGEVSELIYKAYSAEAQIKRKVLEDVAHFYSKSWKMLCLATWVHQPYIPEDITIELEAMLMETGHR